MARASSAPTESASASCVGATPSSTTPTRAPRPTATLRRGCAPCRRGPGPSSPGRTAHSPGSTSDSMAARRRRTPSWRNSSASRRRGCSDGSPRQLLRSWALTAGTRATGRTAPHAPEPPGGNARFVPSAGRSRGMSTLVLNEVAWEPRALLPPPHLSPRRERRRLQRQSRHAVNAKKACFPPRRSERTRRRPPWFPSVGRLPLATAAVVRGQYRSDARPPTLGVGRCRRPEQ